MQRFESRSKRWRRSAGVLVTRRWECYFHVLKAARSIIAKAVSLWLASR